MSKKIAFQSLIDLYIHEIKDMHSAEKQLLKALPKLAKAAHSEELRIAFKEHAEETEEQINRLEQILQNLDQNNDRGQTCEGMKGIIKESSSLLQEEGEPEVLDAGLIASAQKAEHYEISTYGTLCTWASLLGQKEDYDLLNQNLEEEKKTDLRLTEIAENDVNEEAEDELGQDKIEFSEQQTIEQER